MADETKSFTNDTMRLELRKLLAEETAKFLTEHKEEIVKRAERRIRDEAKVDEQTTFSKLD